MRTCDKCKTHLGPYSPQGLCPRCLLADGLDEAQGHQPSISNQHPAFPRRCGDYELLDEIAHGGMGVVWRARQVSLGRIVALKMIVAGHLAGTEAVRRFRTEAETTASLDHPNIVAIHEVGDHEGQPFFSMQLVAGVNLAAHLAQLSVPPSPEWTARLLATVARAVHYAHQRGILHRDLKPANILIDARGQPHITDFGLAKMIASDTDLTLSGAVMGTPNFMSPEQAMGKVRQLTTATDIYSLGALLYFMLTGKPPFQGETTIEVLRQVTEIEPPRPSTIKPRVDRDLETICLKCLEKDPARRYASSDALADDLERRLRGEPILARPSSLFELTVKWVRREPALAGALAVCATLVALGFTGVTWQWRRAQSEARRAEATVTRLEIERAEMLFAGDRTADALAYLARILRKQPANRVAASRVLSALSHRNFCVPVLGLRHEAMVNSAWFSADGRWLVTASKDKSARVWDSGTGALRYAPLRHADDVLDARFSPDGRWLVTASRDNTARIWDAATGQPNGSPLQHADVVWTAEFSPDSTSVVTASVDGSARVWDLTGQPVTPPLQHSRLPLSALYSARFSPDGRWVATASADHTAVIWNAATGEPQPHRLKQSGHVRFAEFSPDGRLVFVGGHSGDAVVRETGSTQVVATVSHRRYYIYSGAFSPDGQRLLTASDDFTAQQWDLRTGKTLATKTGAVAMKHDGMVVLAEYSPEGERILTASRDGTARLWDARSGEALTQPLRHTVPLRAAHFCPNGQRLVTVSDGPEVWIWDIRLAHPLTLMLRHKECVTSASFSPDGQRVLTASVDKFARVWARTNGQFLAAPAPRAEYLLCAEFSPDGKRLVIAGQDGSAAVCDVATGRQLLASFPHRDRVDLARFSHDGNYVLTACKDAAARVWDAHANRARIYTLRHNAWVTEAEWSPDDQRILTASQDGTARLWDARNGQLLFTLKHDGPVNSAYFSRDGERIVTGSDDKTVRLWSARTGVALLPPIPNDDAVGDACFSPDGERIVTRSRNTARVWNARTGRPVTDLVKHGSRVNRIRWSPDQKYLVSACDDGTTRLWDPETGHWVAEPLEQTTGVTWVEFSPDGRWIVTGTKGGSARIIEVLEVPSSPLVWLAELAEAIAGQRFNALNETEPVPVAALFQLRQRLLQVSAEEPRGRWAQWFFAPAATRPVSPSSTFTVSDYVRARSGSGSVRPQHELAMLQPTNAVVLARLAATLWGQSAADNPRRTNESAWLLRRAVTLEPSHPYVWQAQASVALLHRNYSEALKLCEEALGRQPSDPSLWRFKGDVLVGAKRIDEACGAYHQACELMPAATETEKASKANLLRQRIILLVSLNRWQEALSDCQRVIDCDRSGPEDWWRLALLRLQLGDEAGYRDFCQKMLVQFRELRGTDSAGRMAQISLLLPASGGLLEAACEAADFAEASGRDPMSAPACRLAKGLAEYRQGRFSDAADWMQRTIGQPDLVFGDRPYAPREVAAHAVLAMAQQQLGQPDAARVAVAKATEVFQAEANWPKRPIVDYDRLVAQTLLREAQKVVGDARVGEPPRAK